MLAGALPTRPNNINALLLALVVAMDACWLYVLLRTVHMAMFATLPEIIGVPNPMILAAFEGTALLLSAVLVRWERLPIGAARGLLGVAGLVVVGGFVLFTSPPVPGRPLIEWLVIISFLTLTLLILWSLGSTRFSDRVVFNDVYNVFRNGLVILGISVLLGSTLGPRGARMLEEMGSLPVWFFIWSLAALGVGNRELVRAESGGSSTGGPVWNFTIAVSMSVVVLAGMLTGALTVDSIVQAVRSVFVIFVLAVIFPFFIAASVLLSIVALLLPDIEISGLLGPPGRVSPTPRAGSVPVLPGSDEFTPDRSPLSALPFDVVGVATWVAVAFVIAAVLLLASVGLRRARGKERVTRGQDRESIGSWALFGRQLRGWLGSHLSLAKKPRAEEPIDALAALRGRPEWSGTLSIREIYVMLQKRAAAVGYPRAPQQTPTEYLRTLQTSLPDLAPHLVPITAAYIHARYGPLPASDHTALAAARAWARAEPLLIAAVPDTAE